MSPTRTPGPTAAEAPTAPQPTADAAQPTAARGSGDVMGGRGTPAQRTRAAAVVAVAAVLTALPTPVADALADAAGELTYRVSPERAALARRNLRRVVSYLDAHGLGSTRVRAAAADPAALERLVRAAFRHYVRSYVEVLRMRRLREEGPARVGFDAASAVDAAFGTPGPRVFVSAHLGAMELGAVVLARRSDAPVTAPMEVLDDPELQRLFARGRAVPGVRLVSLHDARRELRAALRRGEPIGIVGDRDVAGGGATVSFFGAPARIPVGPVLLALEFGAPLHVASIRRVRGGYRMLVETLPAPPDGPRRARVEALLAEQARAFERQIALAPDQWWSALFPIWPDLEEANE